MKEGHKVRHKWFSNDEYLYMENGELYDEVCTYLPFDEIELAIVNSGIFNKRNDIIVPNVSWGLLNHEADMVVMTKSGYLTEIEIKRSLEDFKADFKKDHQHDDERVYKFYYCVPSLIKDKVIELLKTRHEFIPAVLSYTEEGVVIDLKVGFPNTNRGRKLFLEEQLTIARLGCMRVWNLKQKLVDVLCEKEYNNNRL